MKYIRQSIDTRVVVILAVFLCVGIILYGSRCITTKVCGDVRVDQLVREEVVITLPKGSIVAERVATQASRELGLSGRKSLPEGNGMLFDFGIPGKYGFWMKDMLFPIDIIWLSESGIVVDIVENATPEEYPATYINEAPATYALELPANSARAHGLYLGTKVTIGE